MNSYLKYLFLLSSVLLATTSVALATPIPFPVFLKQGFSTVLQFEETPTKVVLGDSRSFTVEKLESSLVIRSLVSDATGNLFVYFKRLEPKLIILNASEDADPTYIHKFTEPKIEEPKITPSSAGMAKKNDSKSHITTQMKVQSFHFNHKKDYLLINAYIDAASEQQIQPKWDQIRLTFKNAKIAADQLWSERKTIQKDSRVKFRLVFAKPDIPKNMKDVRLTVPIEGQEKPMSVLFGGAR